MLPLPRAAVISTRLRVPTHALFPVSTAPSATPIPSYTPASALVRVRGRGRGRLRIRVRVMVS